MMLKVWLYAFALGVTSTRRLEQRFGEDLPLRYLAGCLQPDHKTLSEFLRRHRLAINEVFTQVLEMARGAGMVQLGHVAIDSSRVQANASRHKWWRGSRRRAIGERGTGGRCGGFSSGRAGRGRGSGRELATRSRRSWRSNSPRVQGFRRSCPRRGPRQVSQTDPDSRFLRTREGWVLGYTAELAVSDDHLIVATRVTQNASDNASLLPLVEEVERQCRKRPAKVTADSGIFQWGGIYGNAANAASTPICQTRT